MLICLDCGKTLKHVKLNHDEECLNDTVICPICEGDNIWDEQLEMYVNDRGVL
jgi:hypothetical protein